MRRQRRPAAGRLTTHYRCYKGQVYEGGIRVPGIIEWPSRLKPRKTSAEELMNG